MGLCAYACACACAHGHGQRALWRRERAQDGRTDSRTTGDTDSGNGCTGDSRRAGGRTAGDSDGQGDGERGQGTQGQGQQDSGTGAGDSETGLQQNGRTKEDFHSHSHAVVVTSPLKQRRPTTLAAGLLVVLVQEEGDLSHKWSPSLHSGTYSGLMRTYLTHFLSGFIGSGAVLFEKWL